MTNDEILQIFFVECEEALGAAEAGLMSCRSGTADAETVNAIFRSVHSIKGGAGAFGFTALQAFTHGFETLLSLVREGSIALDDGLNDLLLRAFDTLADHVGAIRGQGDTPKDDALILELAAACDGMPVASADHAPDGPASAAGGEIDFDLDLDLLIGTIEDTHDVEPWLVRLRPLAGALANGGEPLLLLRELERIGGTVRAVETLTTPDLDHFDADCAFLAWRFDVPGDVERAAIEEIFDFVGDDCELLIERGNGLPAPALPVATTVAEPQAVAAAVPDAQAAATPHGAVKVVEPSARAEEKSAATSGGQSIRIDLVKLDRLIDTVGELIIAQAMMAQRLAASGLGSIDELTLLDGLTRDIQEGAMAIRAQPIQSVFSRVPRILRELETATGKRVRLEMSGESTELDKTVLERLGEPLTHLIRNAVDHGIEPADVRVAGGKEPEGVLRLSAEQRSGRILIKVIDDGRGIDRARVLEKAIEKGLVAPDASLADEEIDNLIFAPGFSTATAVSNISGRGVGMDVVRQNVKDLGGRISIESRPGKGSTFTLALPLTLAISDGMIVTVGDQTLVVPLTHVVESLRPQPHEVQGLGVGRQMLNVRGQFIPILPLEQAAGADGAVNSPCEGVLIIVDTESSGQAALQVDAICDQRQFVIKSLQTHYRSVPGISGATIMGDGRVALIVDVDGLVADAVRCVEAPRRAA